MINSKFDRFPLEEIKIKQDVWNPPINYAKRGRLNKPHESLLYICPDVSTAIEEMHISNSDDFALIVYESIEEIKAVCIGIQDNYKQFSYDERIKLRLLTDFLKDEFTREVGKGTEHLYRISEIIAKDQFDLPPRDVQDAWCYPSVASKEAVNLCLRPDIAQEKLSFKGAQIIRGYDCVEGYFKFNVLAIVTESEADSRKLAYHAVGSDIQNSIFPSIKLANPNDL
jgi:hypothetical protein